MKRCDLMDCDLGRLLAGVEPTTLTSRAGGALVIRCLSLIVLSLWLLMPMKSSASPPASEIAGGAQFEFSLPTTAGSTYRLGSFSSAPLRVVCFLGCECPLALQYGPRLQELSRTYADQGVEFIGVNSNPQDSLADVSRYAKTLQLTFPVLKDHDRIVAARLNAKRTPEVILLGRQGETLYRGRIDDQYQPGIVRNQASRADLKTAIDEALAGKPVSVPVTDAFGCLIAKPRKTIENAAVTYCGQIARVLEQHCVECHRAGEIGPFALDNFDDVVGWADMIVETVQQKRMPPWNANPEHGEFLNARGMSDADRELLERWVESGTPYGDPTSLPQTALISGDNPTEKQPDLSIAMSDTGFPVPAEGTVDYQYFVVDPQLTTDRWVNLAELIPGDRSVVHHGIVFIRPPDGQRIDGVGWLTAYVPGQRIPHSPAYRARRLPAGSKLVFQMHYTPNGKATEDVSRLNLWFSAAEEVTEELMTLISINQELEIPPRMSDVKINAQTDYLPEDGKLLALSPHMHLRGKSMRVQVGDGQGASRVILDVPHYDFNWQHTYVLKDPLPLTNLKNFSFLATFDNSANNPFNPDPDDFVTWGDQTWEEMAIVFYEVARPRGNSAAKTAAQLAASTPRSADEAPKNDEFQKNVEHQRLADEYMQDLDRNRDGKLSYDEVERAVQLQGFRNLDRNGDRLIERSEILDALSTRR